LDWLLGLVLGVAVAGAAWKAGLLTPSGAVAAALIGMATWGGAGWKGAAMMLVFFLSSNWLSRWRSDAKRGLDPVVAKGGRRDAWQVAANGGAAAVLFAASGPQEPHAGPWVAGAAGGLAAAMADTWATEIGVLARRPPRLLTTGREVARGASGGVTTVGLLASLGGAAVIGAVGAWLWAKPALLGIGLVAGLLGSLLDSLLGATLQAGYRCPACAAETERHPWHVCGVRTAQVRGLSWMGNDVVNLLSSAAGALAAMLLWSAMTGN